MAVLSYNEERYGLDRCNMIAFYPRNGAVKEEGVRPKTKAIEQAHMADHVLASVSAVYADFHLAAPKAVRKRHLFRATSREAEPAAKLAKNGQGEACRHHCNKVLTRWHGHEHGHKRSVGKLSLSQHQGDDVHRLPCQRTRVQRTAKLSFAEVMPGISGMML